MCRLEILGTILLLLKRDRKKENVKEPRKRDGRRYTRSGGGILRDSGVERETENVGAEVEDIRCVRVVKTAKVVAIGGLD
jgi:hypothetical protein